MIGPEGTPYCGEQKTEDKKQKAGGYVFIFSLFFLPARLAAKPRAGRQMFSCSLFSERAHLVKKFSSSSPESEFITSSLVSQPRRAVATPKGINFSWSVLWESVETAIFIPFSLALRQLTSFKSSLKGYALTSNTIPSAEAALKNSSKSIS